ncbi:MULTISPECIES: tripartite tricarboxylate transporter TctB family protein [Pontibacillus]|uniref:Tripartite tricarboxylate transporter TctB family protein n=1 Tax=Pontibacillus chungwhensis TaxID=265426 RepID=A0ABY8UVI8_9BACI|nr:MULTISPECIES: tripartite tricarboxylate transporter TctB family protein [Pontibacillus]MCD5325241.1 tripartite tricarboxylate transporter TctB family protein [Pontibacillus sp. HN14]WIF97489.1 tripartite tricarboxylate transporter TctB family protein [Pontibacillus chungwhensis]
MRRFNKETVIASVLVFIFSYAYYEARQLSEMSGIFPEVISLISLILSILYLVKSFWIPVTNRPFEGVDKEKIYAVIGGMVLYGIGLWYVGFLITSLFIVTMLVFLLQDEGSKKQKWVKAGTSSTLICGGFYLLFRFVFLVPLPNGQIFYNLFGI